MGRISLNSTWNLFPVFPHIVCFFGGYHFLTIVGCGFEYRNMFLNRNCRFKIGKAQQKNSFYMCLSLHRAEGRGYPRPVAVLYPSDWTRGTSSPPPKPQALLVSHKTLLFGWLYFWSPPPPPPGPMVQPKSYIKQSRLDKGLFTFGLYSHKLRCSH